MIFIFIFIVSFFISTQFFLTRSFKKHIQDPIHNLLYRIQMLRLDQTEFAWQAKEQTLEEMAEIDEAISHQLSKIRGMHEKMDALLVTEHETGFFHKDRFKEAIKFELYRSSRYHHEFSILVIKLLKISSASESCQMSKTEKMNTFAYHLSEVIRSSDMAFRITEQLFVRLLPETNHQTVLESIESIKNRFEQQHIACGESYLTFDIEVGYSVFPAEGESSNELTTLAMQRLKEAISAHK